MIRIEDHLGLTPLERRVLMHVADPATTFPSRRLETARREARNRLIKRGLIAGNPRKLTLTEAGKRLATLVRLAGPA